MSFDLVTPTFDQLRVSWAVVDVGSFAGAARRFGRAPSVISYSIANPEAQLGGRVEKERTLSWSAPPRNRHRQIGCGVGSSPGKR